MALAYLLSPTFEIVNSAGKPATGGYLEVYVSGSRTKYYCASDFDGTLHPFRIPLDSLGSNIVLAEDDKAYDVYVYNRYGSLLMSRYGVVTGAGNLFRIVSGDGSIDVTWTDNGHIRTYDIRQAEDGEDLLDWFKGIGSSRIEDTTIYRPGSTSGTMEMGEYGPRAGGSQYYHATAHVQAVKTETEPYYDNVLVRFYARSSEGVLTLLESSSCIVDWSQGLTQEFDVSCDLNIASDCEICVSIEGQDVNAGGFELANLYLHRVYSGTPRIPSGVISRAEVESALEGKQDVIDDLSEIRSGAEAGATAVQPGDLAAVATSGSYNDLSNKPDLSVYATKSEVTNGLATKQDTLIAGDNITIEGNVISATGGGGGSTYTAGEGINIDNDEISVDTSVIQEKLTAGSNITISGTTISASAAPQEQADWNQTNSSAVDFIKNKPALATVATSGSYNDLSNKPSIPAAQVQSDWGQTNSGAVDYIKNKPSLATVATSGSYNDLSNKPTIPAAVTVDQTYNSSSANPQSGTAVAGAIDSVNQVPASTASDEDKVLTVDSNGDPVWAPSQGGAQVQSDWTESDTTDPSYIQNKPTEKVLTAGSNVTITDGVSEVTISAADTTYTAGSGLVLNNGAFSVNVGSGLAVTNEGLSVVADQTYSASSTNAQSGVAVAGAIAGINQVPASTASDEDKVLTVNNSGTPVWRTPSGGGGGSGVQADWTESDSTDPSYIQNKPTEKPIVPGNGIAMSEDANSINISVNPATLSSAQLLAIAQAIGVDETVLWEGTITTSGHSNVNVTFQLSESILNFERIEVYCTGGNNNVINFMTWHPVSGATGRMVTSQIMNESENNEVYIGAAIYVEANSDYKTLRYRCGFGSSYGIAYRGDYWGYGVPYKVVGIRRIAGGN